MDKVLGGWSPAIIPGRNSCPALVNCEGHSYPEAAPAVLQVLGVGHVRATCVSTVDRGHLCYRCGGSGHRARGCPASAPKCPLCESFGAPADHRMGEAVYAPSKVKRRRPIREPAAERIQGSTVKAAAVDGREEAMELTE